ncbi:MAG: hypothetical protein HY236_14015 [Acidobacteria bacterium]|nr:hypothetical protein [Acidobacteriota bacterium]
MWIRVGTVVLLGMGLAIPPPAAGEPAAASPPQRRRSAGKAKRKDSTPTCVPLTVDEVAKAIPDVYEGQLRKIIQSCGLAFTATPEALDRLKTSGASEELLQFISRLAPGGPPAPTSAAPKEPPRAGPLTVTCYPPECDVLVNGTSHGATQGGSRTITGLPVGKIFLDYRKKGYEGQQASLTLQPGAPARHSIKLAPTPTMKEKLGAEVFAQLMESLGGEAGLRDVRTLTAAGKAVLWDPSGARTDWTVNARLQLPDRVYWEMQGAGLKWWVSRVGEKTRTGGSGKLRGSLEAKEIEKGINEFLSFQLVALVDRIHDGKMRLLAGAGTPSGQEGLVLRAEGDVETFVLTLGQDFLPAKVVYESASGLGSGLQVLYSDYRPQGQSHYPMTLVVKFADAVQHGMELRFARLEPNAKLRDKDFPR